MAIVGSRLTEVRIPLVVLIVNLVVRTVVYEKIMVSAHDEAAGNLSTHADQVLTGSE